MPGSPAPLGGGRGLPGEDGACNVSTKVFLGKDTPFPAIAIVQILQVLYHR